MELNINRWIDPSDYQIRLFYNFSTRFRTYSKHLLRFTGFSFQEGYFCIVNDSLTGTNCCNNRTIGYQMFRVFVLRPAKPAATIVMQAYTCQMSPKVSAGISTSTRNLFLLSSSMILAFCLMKFRMNNLDCLVMMVCFLGILVESAAEFKLQLSFLLL